MPTTIKVRQNGSYLVEGDDVKLIDWNGNEYKPANPQRFALCRCGHSTTKPFCDSTHSKVGFQAAEAALGPEAQDRPATAVPPGGGEPPKA
jgi:3-phenylpropionate/trans-cinnamate dioxygenase ferredoxin subunit